MAIREALLGLLADGPKYGYQLKAEFEAATGEAWTLNIGQVYTTLGRLTRDGAVDAMGTDSEGRDQYELTATGREELAAWFSEPVDRRVTPRDDVAMKLLVAVATRSVDPRTVIDVQRASTMTALQDATRLKAEGGALPWRLHLDRVVITAEAELRWLDLVEARLDDEGPPPKPTVEDTTVKDAHG